MAVFEQAPVWEDTPGAVSGSTPFGLYDNDPNFVKDAPNFAKWCARRFGYPVIEIELVDYDFYACFEEAVSDFANQVNQFNIRENRLAVQGLDSNIDLTQKTIQSTGLNQVIRLSKEYGAEAGAGGNITWRRGSIEVTQAQGQKYDLNQWATDNVSGSVIEIKKVFHEGRPAVSRYYDPFVESGLARNNLMDEFGWGGWQPAIEYVLFPIYEDLLRVQSVELNDQIRRSAYSFEIINNQITIFPRPTSTFNLWFEYILTSDRDKAAFIVPSGSTYEEYSQSTGSQTQSDFSNIGYQNIPYHTINQPGLQWIRKYGLACAKETLGMVRGKYQQIPIPNAEVNLDGDTLRSEAAAEKTELITQLRETLEASSMQQQWQKKTEQEQAMISSLKNVPPVFGIYVA